jgi:hypothetical protein
MPAAPVPNPLGPPSVSGTTITLDVALNQPTIITRTIARLAAQNFFADQVFSVGGDVSGGAVLFERPPAVATDLFAERDVQEVAPGEEFPLLTVLRGQPVAAYPRKLGGKWYITREARKRNDTRLLARYMQSTANTIARKVDQLAIALLESAISTFTRTYAGQSWGAAAAVTFNTKTAANQPLSDIIGAQAAVSLEERGHQLDSIVLHPNEWANLVRIYGADGVNAALNSAGIRNVIVSQRITAGTAYLFEQGMVGFWRNEFPLSEETEEEGVAAGGRQRTWYQASVSPVMGVDDQYALLKLTGIA